eukprot:767407-Hanusia_phi.AAC.2
MTRIFKECNKLEVQELPPFVYQLLLMSNSGKRNAILMRVLDVFNQMDSKIHCNPANTQCSLAEVMEIAEEELIHVQGTVMLHFTFAVKQDLSMGQDLLKIFRSRMTSLSSFEVALLLSISSVHRYENKAMDILKKSIENDFVLCHYFDHPSLSQNRCITFKKCTARGSEASHGCMNLHAWI